MQDRCDVYCYDQDKVERLEHAVEEMNMEAAVRLFKLMGEANRFKILYAMALEGEICVCDGANLIGASLAKASHHFQALRKAGLLERRKEGKQVFYQLKDTNLKSFILGAADQQGLAVSLG